MMFAILSIIYSIFDIPHRAGSPPSIAVPASSYRAQATDPSTAASAMSLR
jgi:hypothetical protein